MAAKIKWYRYGTIITSLSSYVYICMCTAIFLILFFLLLLIAMFYHWRCMHVWYVQLNSTYLISFFFGTAVTFYCVDSVMWAMPRVTNFVAILDAVHAKLTEYKWESLSSYNHHLSICNSVYSSLYRERKQRYPQNDTRVRGSYSAVVLRWQCPCSQ